ncbi:MAG: hypothetical protein Q7S40_23875 [Opitutaceae bacterium]|nr:hypothetical protein [Opitutaceae bacterium]
MTHDPSRKHFFARLLGFAAAGSVLPTLFAKSTPAITPANSALPSSGKLRIRPDARAVARRADTV